MSHDPDTSPGSQIAASLPAVHIAHGPSIPATLAQFLKRHPSAVRQEGKFGGAVWVILPHGDTGAEQAIYRLVDFAVCTRTGHACYLRPREPDPVPLRLNTAGFLVFPAACSLLGGAQSVRWTARFAWVTTALGNICRIKRSDLPPVDKWTSFTLANKCARFY